MPDLIKSLQSIGGQISPETIYYSTSNSSRAHQRKISRRGFELQIRDQEKSGFTMGALATQAGEGSKVRLSLWNVLQLHDTKMDNLALIYEDYRDDFVFSFDA